MKEPVSRSDSQRSRAASQSVDQLLTELQTLKTLLAGESKNPISPHADEPPEPPLLSDVVELSDAMASTAEDWPKFVDEIFPAESALPPWAEALTTNFTSLLDHHLALLRESMLAALERELRAAVKQHAPNSSDR